MLEKRLREIILPSRRIAPVQHNDNIIGQRRERNIGYSSTAFRAVCFPYTVKIKTRPISSSAADSGSYDRRARCTSTSAFGNHMAKDMRLLEFLLLGKRGRIHHSADDVIPSSERRTFQSREPERVRRPDYASPSVCHATKKGRCVRLF